MKIRILPPIIIYLIAFTIVLWYGLSHLPVNDGVKEYLAFIQNINEGWQFRLTLVNSCLITTYLPALLWDWFGGDKLFIFRFIPALLYPLMPMFTYLIARKYLSVSFSIIASLMVLCSSYFLFFPDIGRVGVGIAFMAGTLWAILNKNLKWSIMFSILVVFTHYGSAMVLIAVLGIACLLYLISYRKVTRYFIISLIILIATTGLWHFGVAGYSGEVMSDTLLQNEKTGYAPLYGKDGEPIVNAILDPKTREPAVQEALFLNASEMPIPKIIEVVSNWLVVLLVSLGLFFTIKDKRIDKEFKVLSLSSYILIALTVLITWLSIYYGGMRVFFSTSMLLATYFVFGAKYLDKLTNLHISWILVVVLIFYALSTSGLIYNIFGLHKWLPIVIQLEG